MALLNWSESYSVYIEQSDLQHKKLFELINILNDSLNSGDSKESVLMVLDDLFDYTVYHFTWEENLLQTCEYPDLISHKLQHSSLIDQVASQKALYYLKGEDIAMDLMNFLKAWIINHIIGSDMKYGSFIKASRN